MRRFNDELERSEAISLDSLKYQTVHLPYDKDKFSVIKVPKFLINAFKFLHEHHYLEKEGIFRKQGNASKITGVESCFASGDLTKDLSIYDVCVLVKRFTKSIKGGLFGAKEERIIDSAFDQHAKETPRTLCHFCHTLPTYNYGILSYIIFQLSRVVRHSGENKMDAGNLAIIFVPAMFQSFDRQIIRDTVTISGIKERQEVLKTIVIMLIKHVTDLIIPQTMLRNNSINRSTNSQPLVPTANKIPVPVRATPQRSSSMSINRSAIVIPRYTHAAAPNVARIRGTAGALVDNKNKDKTVLRTARKRSKSMLRGVINFVSGSTEQYYVNENADPNGITKSFDSSKHKQLNRVFNGEPLFHAEPTIF